jgi:thioredoxin 1
MSAATNINAADWEKEVIQSDLPVMVDMWATWCGPCKMIAPHVDAVAAEYAGKLKVVKFDIDTDQTIPGSFGVRSIPTLLFFKGGQLVDTIVGATPKEAIVKKVEGIL